MLILKRGISGYECNGKIAPLINYEAFRATCHYAASQLGVSVLESKVAYSNERPYHNYHLTWLSHKYEKSVMTVLFLNAHYPILAFSNVTIDSAEKQLPDQWLQDGNNVEDSQLLSCFTPQYHVISTGELREPLVFQHDSRTKVVQLKNPNELCSDELKLIYQWRPQTVSDILFNEWD